MAPDGKKRTVEEAAHPRDTAKILAAKGARTTSSTSSTRALYFVKAALILLLAAAYSPISQLALSPVYGSVGANVYHDRGLTFTALFVLLVRDKVESYLPTNIKSVLPILAFWIPSIQYALFQYSDLLGNPNGPFWTECLTYFPLVALSLYSALQYIDISGLGSFEVGGVNCVPAGSFLIFSLMRKVVKAPIFKFAGRPLLGTRVGMQLTVALLYASLLPSKLLVLSIPSIAFTGLGNVHAPFDWTTNILNSTLASHNYTLLERRESLTGYISVLENRGLKFRAMRCDHSLLGGEWILPQREGQPRLVSEPIYAIFTMLEAVRLVKTENMDGVQQKALNIGLGVGTAPTALVAHGIETDVFELDPAVHYFASKYFNLARGINTKLGDAVENVQNLIDRDAEQIYDYIIHDVFTGGAEPVSLFTTEFLSNLRTLLKHNGVIAINYAGDLSMPAASLIYRTINSVFPSCRVFREVEAPLPDSTKVDFTNMVFFCTKNSLPVEFRKPIENDFLGSGARQEHLLPKHEISPANFEHEGSVLTSSDPNSVKILERWQVRSAIGHWKVMRTVIPLVVWENW